MSNTPADKKSSIEHVAYEIRMLFETAMEIPKYQGNVVLGSALLESFLIHLRNLHDFIFVESKSRDTDIFARDYFTNPNQWQLLLQEKQIVKSLLEERKSWEEIKTRINVEIGHITTLRKSQKEEKKVRAWQITNMVNKIIPSVELLHKELLKQFPEDEYLIPIQSIINRYKTVANNHANSVDSSTSGATMTFDSTTIIRK